MKATLILANGAVFHGEPIGACGDRVCELVFNTSMNGYQEILTEPAYAGQGVVMSYPLIGNYGVNSEDNESRRAWVEALVIRHLAPRGSNFRCEGSLDDFLKEHNIVGIQGVDTRALTRILRNQGSMNCMITCAEHFNINDVLEQLAAYKVEGAVEKVTRTEVEIVPAEGEQKYRVALLDVGVRSSMISALTRRGCEVTVYPAATAAEEILSGKFDGVVISEGPGDPAENPAVVSEIKKLYESQLPIFAASLGHQLLALAAGAKTCKLPFGHRGASQSVRDLATNRCFVTAQNHGYAVDDATVDPQVAEVIYVNVNDGSVEGLEYKRANCFSVQFSPDAALTPEQPEYLYDRFIACMGGDR